MDCVAYDEKGKTSKCRIVSGIDRLLVALRPGQRPVATTAPKVTQ